MFVRLCKCKGTETSTTREVDLKEGLEVGVEVERVGDSQSSLRVRVYFGRDIESRSTIIRPETRQNRKTNTQKIVTVERKVTSMDIYTK